MLYEILKVIVLVFGPLAVYTCLRATLEVPELITELPTVARRLIEIVGAMFIIGAGFVPYVGALGGAMAVIGLLLLLTPLTARKLSRSRSAYIESWQ